MSPVFHYMGYFPLLEQFSSTGGLLSTAWSGFHYINCFHYINSFHYIEYFPLREQFSTAWTAFHYLTISLLHGLLSTTWTVFHYIDFPRHGQFLLHRLSTTSPVSTTLTAFLLLYVFYFIDCFALKKIFPPREQFPLHGLLSNTWEAFHYMEWISLHGQF